MTMMMILPYWDKWSHFICAYHLFSWDTIIPHSSYLVFLLSIRQLTITTAYYRGAMGILLVYDVTDESSFDNIRNWIRNIEQHASDNVNKILVGNKVDMDAKRVVSTAQGQKLADEYGIKFFETSAKTNRNVEQVFFAMARDVKQRLTETVAAAAEPPTIQISRPDPDQADAASSRRWSSSCCNT
ncbi:ras-related protein RABE1c isoform X3 [Zea mays]|uniref:ras-related protein RABE1c isoform X3 n=1 Tax=Zea mays TaxID=4577 RepID=UPI0004DE8208|nr:uncharacterized protein LOC100282517 isoform X3 [Zea mays]|eukprot:XP_008667972.1 uncharacterized protein LOC100282517 isoform X3 [Zea mays]